MIILLNALLLTHLFLRALTLFLGPSDIDLLRTLRRIYEKGDTVVDNFGKTGSYRNFRPLPFFQFHAGDPDINGNHHILMVREDPLLAVRCRNDKA